MKALFKLYYGSVLLKSLIKLEINKLLKLFKVRILSETKGSSGAETDVCFSFSLLFSAPIPVLPLAYPQSLHHALFFLLYFFLLLWFIHSGLQPLEQAPQQLETQDGLI